MFTSINWVLEACYNSIFHFSPNVTLGIGPPPSVIAAASTSMPTSQPTKFQWATEDSTFTGTSNPWSSNTTSGGTATSVQAVPLVQGQGPVATSYNISPLSDILSDLSSPTGGSTPNQSLSPNLPIGSPSQVRLFLFTIPCRVGTGLCFCFASPRSAVRRRAAPSFCFDFCRLLTGTLFICF